MQLIINNASVTLTSKAYTTDGEVKSEVTNLHAGDKFEVTFSISEASNLGDGINIIGGNFEFDENILELDIEDSQEAINEKLDVWEYNYDKVKKTFTSDTINDDLVKNSSDDILTLKFKVKDGINFADQESLEAVITLNNMTAGTGKLRRKRNNKSS